MDKHKPRKIDSFTLMAKELIEASKLNGNEERAKEILGDGQFLKTQIISLNKNKVGENKNER
jgi:hypothetical protein